VRQIQLPMMSWSDGQRVCNVVKEEFVPRGFLPYLPDTNFVMCSYAVSVLGFHYACAGQVIDVQLLSLLKLLKPELRPYHDSEESIFALVEYVKPGANDALMR